jgi:hypothetical protein
LPRWRKPRRKELTCRLTVEPGSAGQALDTTILG